MSEARPGSTLSHDEHVDGPGDAELISAVRTGDVDAYGVLFERHVDAARRLARQLVSGNDIDDLVSEAFAKVLGVLQRGGGPDLAFRAYLLTSVRRLHVDRIRANQRLHTTDDMDPFDPGVPFHDTAVANFESGAAAKAFDSLPERWQLVLWHTEVEGQKPAEIAPLLGMTPNSVAALAYRAREGLRQAFVAMHAQDAGDDDCDRARANLGAFIRGGISRRDGSKVEAHLKDCRPCSGIYLELTEVNSDLAGLLGPIVLGGVSVSAYLGGSTLTGGGLLGGATLLFGRAKEWTANNSTTGAVAGVAVAAVVAGGLAVGIAGLGDDEESTPPAAMSQPEEDDAAGQEAPSGPGDDEPAAEEPPAEDPPAETTEDVPPAAADAAPQAGEPAAAPPNSPPQLQAPVIRVDARDAAGPVTIDVVQGATDADGDPLRVDSARLTDTSDGTVLVGSPRAGGGSRTMIGQAPARDGRPQTVTFIPEAGTRGTVTIVYALTDGEDTVTGRVEVLVPNTAPEAEPDNGEVDAWAVGRPSSVRIPVLANDSDANGDRLRLAGELVEGPRKGRVERRGDMLVYTPERGRTGRDTFRYEVSDGHGDRAVGLVRVKVTGPPLVAVDDRATTRAEKKVDVDVLANDSHAGGQVTGATVVRGEGRAKVEGDKVSFRPDADFAGEARLRYTVEDRFGQRARAFVRIRVKEPVANAELGPDPGSSDDGVGHGRHGRAGPSTPRPPPARATPDRLG